LELQESHVAEPHADVRCVTVSLSGGGYRATAFTAGALLALADSELGEKVVSISSVSGGSLTSALTFGGFAGKPRPASSSDAMAHRVEGIARLVSSTTLATQYLTGVSKSTLTLMGLTLSALILFPSGLRFPNGSLSHNALWFGFVVLAAAYVLLVTQQVLISLIAVQNAVEEAMRPLEYDTMPLGFEMRHLNREEVSRVFCATDLTSGEHVYIGAKETARVGDSHDGTSPPRLLVADVVAASAGFPGLRPLVFGLDELGLADTGDRTPPVRPRRVFWRGVRGTISVILVGIPVILLLCRAFGAFPGAATLGILLGSLLLGLTFAVWSSRRLVSTDTVQLVDGGVCDNLGAAFAIATADERYGDRLTAMLRLGRDPQGTMVFVIDASKPLAPPGVSTTLPRGGCGRRSFGNLVQLVPLRLRVLNRSVVQLIGNANGNARRATIRMLLKRGELSGAFISILDAPTKPEQGVNWTSLRDRNSRVPTTLSALDSDVTAALILQGYRLVEEKLIAEGFAITGRTSEEISAIVSAKPPTRGAAPPRQAFEPYQRRMYRLENLGTRTLFFAYLAVIAVVGFLLL
jgi:hypothetical protein